MTEEVTHFIDRWKSVFTRVAAIPFVFLGVGFYRAWIAALFRYDAYPSLVTFDYFIFEAAIGVICFVLAFAARKVTPLWSNTPIRVATALCTVGGSALIVISGLVFESEAVKLAGLLLAGGGLASIILMWAEFYGSLNPMRVAIYHALAIFVGEAIKWVFLGLDTSYLSFFAITLPLLSLACVKSSMKRLPPRDLPKKPQKSAPFAFPWKPIVLMSVCTFAGGFGALPIQPLLPVNALGAMFVTALVFFGAFSASKWFNFDTIYQLAFPLFILGFLFVIPSFGANPYLMAFCYEAGYAMLSMFIMLVLSNITYRFGISAVWLSGIERGIRYLVELLGWGFFLWASTNMPEDTTSALYTGIVIVMVIVFVFIFFTERGLSAKWGITLDEDAGAREMPSPGRLSMRVSDLSKAHNLSPREEEVLQLLARKETMKQIEQDLYVAHGTLKAHISHIYRKLSIHSRAELYQLLEDPENIS